MRAPTGEVTLFEGMGDALAAALLVLLATLVAIIVMVVWVVANARRRPEWTKKVVLLSLAVPFLLVTPLVWKAARDDMESYPARLAAYEVELAEHRADCAASAYPCLFEPIRPDEPHVPVARYVIQLGIGVLLLVAGSRMRATDR